MTQTHFRFAYLADHQPLSIEDLSIIKEKQTKTASIKSEVEFRSSTILLEETV